MRTIKYISSLLLFFVVLACQENEIPMYSDPAAIYFPNYNEEADSLTYSFTMSKSKRDTLNVAVKLLGNPLLEDRTIPIRVIENKTTAKVGVHYQSFGEVVMKKGEGVCNIPIIVDYQKEMDTTIFTLALELYENSDIQIGYINRSKIRVQITNQLIQPYYWDSLLIMYFGAYSKVKHQKAIDIMGHDFPLYEHQIEIKGYNYYMIKGRELCYYYALNETYDENGDRIEIWDPF